MSKPDAKAFLAKLGAAPEIDDPPPAARAAPVPAPQPAPQEQAPAEVHRLPTPARAKKAKPAKPSRASLKHFGGYLDDDTLEKIALLRIRLKKDNSELIKYAIEELHRKIDAKRAFGDR